MACSTSLCNESLRIVELGLDQRFEPRKVALLNSIICHQTSQQIQVRLNGHPPFFVRFQKTIFTVRIERASSAFDIIQVCEDDFEGVSYLLRVRHPIGIICSFADASPAEKSDKSGCQQGHRSACHRPTAERRLSLSCRFPLKRFIARVRLARL